MIGKHTRVRKKRSVVVLIVNLRQSALLKLCDNIVILFFISTKINVVYVTSTLIGDFPSSSIDKKKRREESQQQR